MPFWLQCCKSRDIACRKNLRCYLGWISISVNDYGLGWAVGGGGLRWRWKNFTSLARLFKRWKTLPTHKSLFSVEVAPYHAIYLIVMSQWIALSNFAEYKWQQRNVMFSWLENYEVLDAIFFKSGLGRLKMAMPKRLLFAFCSDNIIK